MLGYFDDQIATESAFNANGWFMTGDLGWLDANGYLRVTGRKKDVIIRGGHNINPARIEDLAMRHAAIERAAALPIADPRLGERICLAVQFCGGQPVATGRYPRHLAAAGLSKYEMPEFFAGARRHAADAERQGAEGGDLLQWVREGRLVPTPVPATRERSKCARSWLMRSGRSRTASLREFADPVPGPDEVLVDVQAAAANFVDLLVIGGTYQHKPKLPFVPGKGAAGVVTAVGAQGDASSSRATACWRCARRAATARWRLPVPTRCHRLPDKMSLRRCRLDVDDLRHRLVCAARARPLQAGRGGAGARRLRRRRAWRRCNLCKRSAARRWAAFPIPTRPTWCARPAPMRSSISPRRI